MLNSSHVKMARNGLLILMLLYAFAANIQILVKLNQVPQAVAGTIVAPSSAVDYAKEVGALMTTVGVISVVLSLLLVFYLTYHRYGMTEMLSIENVSFVLVSIVVLALGSYIVDVVNKGVDVKDKLSKVCVAIVVLTSALFGANVHALIVDSKSIENNLKKLLQNKVM